MTLKARRAAMAARIWSGSAYIGAKLARQSLGLRHRYDGDDIDVHSRARHAPDGGGERPANQVRVSQGGQRPLRAS